ncbi:MAG: hypothetical protein V3U92_15860 [Cellulophaga sp.]
MKPKYGHKIISLALAILLLSYVIYGASAMLYFMANQDAISKTLCVQKENPMGCDGKCYLSKLLAKSESPSNKEIPNPTTEENLRPLLNFDLPIDEFSLALLQFKSPSKIKDSTIYRLLNLYKKIEVPPPELA